MNRSILENKFFLSWALVHLAVFIFFLTTLLCGTRFKINAGLFDILPESSSSKEAKDAENVLSSKTGRMFLILVKDKEFSAAKEKAVRLYDLLNSGKNSEYFENIDLYVDDNVFDEIYSFYSRHRYHLLSKEETELLSTDDGVEQFIAESQAQLFLGTSTSIDADEDPFALSETAIQGALSKLINSGTSMQVLDGVLCKRFGDHEYIMIRGLLKPEGVSITNKKSGVKIIKDCIAQLREEIKAGESDAEIFVSGIPFHSYESSSSAQKEISIIATVSIILIVLLCFYIFKNAVPVVFSVGAITLSSLCALCTVLTVFKEIHILTFVFGTTLIGTCLDYSIHYFVRWKSNNSLKDGSEIRNHLLKGLTLSLISTLISYILLAFTPFTLLKQISVFSAAGILSSYLTVTGFYPLIKMPGKRKEIKLAGVLERLSLKFDKKKKQAWFVKLIFVICILFIQGRNNIKIDNSLRSMYSMKGELLNNEAEVSKVLNSGTTGWYFIVKGKTAEEVLEKEEKLCEGLADENKDPYSKCNCVTKFIPSVKRQKESYAALEKILPFAEEQYELLSYESADAKQKAQWLKNNYISSKDNYVTMDGDVPEFIKKAAGNFWLGKIGDCYYTCVMPVNIYDTAMLKKLADQDNDFYFVNKTGEIESELNRLTKIILILLGAAFVIMAVILKIFYRLKDVLKIMSVPLVTAASCIAVLGVCKIPLGFFSVTGIVLVFGLSIDYIIYSIESASNKNISEKSMLGGDVSGGNSLGNSSSGNSSEGENTLSIVLSFTSSALSFGLLALSSFNPVFVFGLTVFAGLTAALTGTFFTKYE